MKKLLFVHFILTGIASFAQTGAITGTVTDGKTGESLPGATVLLENSGKAVATDPDGIFSIAGLSPGEYTLLVSYISYNNKKISPVRVVAGQTAGVAVLLETSASQELQEVEVTVKLNREGNTSLTLQQKNAAAVSDGISAESIRRTPDRNTADVLKRVSGASLQDNKFAIIRGLNDRYNAAFLNGSPLPSTESDKKAFAFDIFPAMIIDNMVVLKTATPDMPAEFAGGIIQVNTKSVPDSAFQSISIGGSHHSLTTFKDFSHYKGGKTDWLGIDDGTRALPATIPSTKQFEKLTNDEKGLMARELTPGWKVDRYNALPGASFQYAAGAPLQLGKKDAGFTFAYSYRNSITQNENVRREFEEAETGVVQRSELNDRIFNKSVLTSALFNSAVSLNENNHLSFRNLYSVNSNDRLTVREGVREMDNDPHQFEKAWNFWFTSNRFYSGQLQGEHFLPSTGIKATWTGGFSDTRNSIPNMRRMVYQKMAEEEDDSAEPYVAVVQNNGTIPTAAGNMFWSDTREKIYSLRYDVAFPVNIANRKTELKAGGMQQLRERNFDARNLGYSRYRKSSQPAAPFDHSLLLLPPEEIFDPAHMGLQENGLGGFKLDEATKVHDSYEASSLLHAGYAMLDTRVWGDLRIIAGARVESYMQHFRYIELGSNAERTVDTTVTDLLPSVNIVYPLTRKSNLRASWYQTVSRPEFRELAPFQFYNFATDNIISGSPTLSRALIRNADIRYEVFPGYGQIFSVSGFYKHFENPIELFMRTGTSGAAELSYTNVPSAVNYGVELEYRVRLSFLGAGVNNGFIHNTTLYTNVALIRSSVDLSDINGANERPLQGQSPYLVNGGLMYNDPDNTWNVSVSYNLIGPRVFIVGNVQEPDVWEKGRHVVDLQIGKTFADRLSVKLNVRDLLATDLIFYQNLDENRNYEPSADNLWQATTYGRTISVSAAYRF